MPEPDTLILGGDLEVRRLGFGAMRITGEGISPRAAAAFTADGLAAEAFQDLSRVNAARSVLP